MFETIAAVSTPPGKGGGQNPGEQLPGAGQRAVVGDGLVIGGGTTEQSMS